MDNEFRKPYLASIFGCEPKETRYVYPREDLIANPIFPYLVLDGGAYLFINEHFGDVGSGALLEKTVSGEVFDLLRNEDGKLDWLHSLRVSADLGFYPCYEWQSWPQRLYLLLPLAQKYLQTHEALYAEKWLEILRLWVKDSPYEPLAQDVLHVFTSMKWRDMQVSWRSAVLLHSIYMLGTWEDTFPRETWQEIYDFLVLNLDHLIAETDMDMEQGNYGNHTLQKGVALLIAGTVMPELPRAEVYRQRGRVTVETCFRENVMPDGGTKEVGPSYNHFISRLYLEAQCTCERNGSDSIPGLRESLIRQYRLLAATATREGKSLLFSDGYSMDAHADICIAARLLGFEPDFRKETVLLPHNQYVMLRNRRCELALDAMQSFGGHQHAGRMQPLLWADGKPLLVDTGCFNYDLLDKYLWCKTAQAHSVVTGSGCPERKTRRDVVIIAFDPEANTVTACQTARSGETAFRWTRRVQLLENGARFEDTVESDKEQTFRGFWYLPDRTTYLEDEPVSEGQTPAVLGYAESGLTARQSVGQHAMALRCTEPMSLSRAPGMDENNRKTHLAQLTWTKTGKKLTVVTTVCLE